MSALKFRVDWRNPRHTYVSVFATNDAGYGSRSGQLVFGTEEWEGWLRERLAAAGFVVEDFVREGNRVA